MFLQRLYLEHLKNIGYYGDWLYYHFADLYHLTLHPKTFSKGLTYLIDTDTQRLVALHKLWENLSPWLKKPSNISEWRRKYSPDPRDEKEDPTGKGACDEMDTYSSEFKTDRPLLEGKEKQTQRKMLHWFSHQNRYNNPQIIWDRLDIQKAIFEAKGSAKLVTVVATEVYRKLAEKQAKINRNYQSLYLNGRQALTMDLDKIE
ncbi:hypothetical protein BO99DRAFT_434088 [Aspergillus violaceofuscus CBS 115571]|uniref:Uncharacterized protein n=1 Tax=Aspergillus violaceofuscus (strain CBS 115571) TaxID=1450538 RepID=A0A2V5H1X3_ASPV1|nr:hypothetical protein BO99DRAFT_434088 [Aspergillus violaceofuscus CBS 115571]